MYRQGVNSIEILLKKKVKKHINLITLTLSVCYMSEIRTLESYALSKGKVYVQF